MKNLVIAVAVAALGLSGFGASGAAFGDESNRDGQIAASRLAEMGLGGMATISDQQGMEVRGSGFVIVFGKSYARGGGSDHYFKVRRHRARGSSFSYGGGSWAGGFARAYAR